MRALPDGFLLGCATSAYQVEGGLENDWEAWARAGRLHVASPGCGRATDHWNRYEADFDLLAAMGADAYRMSVEWSRIEPEAGRFDDEALAGYVAMIDALCARGIEPFVTLLHFTHPTWFHETCPWHAGDEAPERFERFVRHVVGAFGARVRFYTPLNEPSVWVEGAYLAGLIPPGLAGIGRAGAAMGGLLRGHGRAYRAIHELVDDARVGVAQNLLRFEASRWWHPADRIASRYADQFHNQCFLEGVRTGRLRVGFLPGLRLDLDVADAKDTLDFIGVNYYSRVYIEANPLKRKLAAYYEDRGKRGVTDLGWEIHPEGLREALLDASRHGLPLYVTENGLDDRDDSRRAAFLYDHLDAALRARADGADVRGYFHWSLLDNFEWLEAFDPRFGLFAVDYETLERTKTAAVDVFTDIAKARALPDERPPSTPKVGAGRTFVG